MEKKSRFVCLLTFLEQYLKVRDGGWDERKSHQQDSVILAGFCYKIGFEFVDFE